jgi:hypothetical protein
MDTQLSQNIISIWLKFRKHTKYIQGFATITTIYLFTTIALTTPHTHGFIKNTHTNTLNS